ncbi:unnamed protein product [Boreogadus saida]
MAALAIIDRHDEFPHKPLLMAFVLLQPDVVVVVVRRRAWGRLTDMRPQSGCGELGGWGLRGRGRRGGEVSTEVQLVWDGDGNEMDCDWERSWPLVVQGNTIVTISACISVSRRLVNTAEDRPDQCLEVPTGKEPGVSSLHPRLVLTDQ